MSFHRPAGLLVIVCLVVIASAGLAVAGHPAATNSDAVAGVSTAGLATAQEEIPEELDIGTVTVGDTNTKTFTVTNPTNFTLRVTGSSITGEDGDAFTIVDGGSSVTVGPSDSHSFTVEFAPTRAGDYDATLTVETNAPSSPHSIALDGQGTERPSPTAELSPGESNFGNVQVGSEVTTSFVLENTGDADLEIDDVTVSGSDAFGVDAVDVSTLSPNAKTTITVTFAPTESGAVTGTLSVASNDSDNPTVSASLTGEGVETSLGVSPGSVSFGEQRAGTTTTKTVKVTNDGDTAVTLTEVEITGEDSDSFEIASESPEETLAAGDSVSIDISFSPWRAGGFGAQLSIGSNSSEISPIDVSLSGTGVAPNIGTNPESINFGEVEVDSSTTSTVTVRNKGSVALTVDETSIVGANPGAFSVESGGGSFTLGPGESRTVTVAFEPTSGGTKAAQLRFISDDPDSPQTDVWLSNTRTVVKMDMNYNRVTQETGMDLEFTDSVPGTTQSVDFTAPSNAKVVTPLTTLVQAQAENRLTQGSNNQVDTAQSISQAILQAKTKVEQQLGIDGKSVDILEDDYVLVDTDSGNADETARAISDQARAINKVLKDARTEVHSATAMEVETAIGTAGASHRLAWPQTTGTSPRFASLESSWGYRGGRVGSPGVSVQSARQDLDFTLRLTAHDRPLASTPEFDLAERNGTVPVQYLNVSHSVPDTYFEEVTFTTSVNKNVLAALNVTIEDYAMYRNVDGEWVELDTDVVNETEEFYVVEVTSPGFSDFIAGVKQPKFVLMSTELSTATITSGDAMQVQTTVSNDGGADGTYTARLLLNGEEVERKAVTIASGGVRVIEFEREITTPGTYTVMVNGEEAGSLDVESADPGETTTDSPSESEPGNDGTDGTATDGSEEGSTSPGQPGFTAVTALAALIAIVLFSLRQRR